MKEKDYYLILGVSRSESAEGIKAAFRKLAKKYHPDKSGPEGTRRFQDLAEAYSVLSDPDARASYTEELRRRERGERILDGWGYSDRASTFSRAYAEEVLRRFRFYSQASLFDILLGMLHSGSGFRHKPTYPGVLNFELVLSHEEALRGGHIFIQIPIRQKCPGCGGSGGHGPFVCLDCEGSGSVIRIVPYRMVIPPEVEDGDVLENRVGAGIRDSILIRIRVRIDEHAEPE